MSTYSSEPETKAPPKGIATLQDKAEGIINFVSYKCPLNKFEKVNINDYINKAMCTGNGKCNGLRHKEQHEAIWGECMPYFDFDVKMKDRAELLAFQGKAEATITEVIKAMYPHCKLYCSISHGPVRDKDNDIFKFSMHIVMRGDGYFSKAPNIKKFYIKSINEILAKYPVNNIKITCDPEPYHNGRQLMRCLFANKGKIKNIKGDDDEEEEEEKTDFRTFHPREWFKNNEDYKYYFAQYIGEEELSEHDGVEGTLQEKEKIIFNGSRPSTLDVFKDDNDDMFITTNEDMEIKEDNKQTAKKQQADKENDTEGDEIVLTFDELSEVVNSLNNERFKSYNEWCHLLWIITRYCDKMNYDPDDTWELLEDFCKTCEGWQKGAVRKKMNEAHKITDHKQIKKMGTLLMWLKEDNKTIFNKYVKSKITQNKTTASEFDKMNPYVWIDFRQDHDGILFASRAELDNSIRTKINLVLARISEGKGIFLKKDAIDNVSSISNLTDNNNFMVCYEGKEGKVQQTELLEYIKRMMPPPLKLYSKMGCFPLKESCPKGVYNVWYGIKAQEVKEVDEEKIKPFLYILKSLWANDDERVYKYLIAWFRLAICEPEKMIRVALFLYSKKEGTGKGRIVDFITDYVLGPAVCHIFTGMDQVLAEHNTNIAGKKIICINEMAATKKEFLSNFDKLKPIISDKYISENPKFQKITQVENITNVIMCTQHKNSIYIKRGNRRFTCLEVSDKKKEDEKFWIDLSNNYMNQEAGNHFYTWLLRQDKTQLPNPSIFCETKLRKEIIQISHDNTESFMDIITKNDGEDSDEFARQAQEFYEIIRVPNEKDGLYYIKCADMYNLYKVYCNECGEIPKTLNAFKANSDIENVLTIKQIDGIKHYRVL